MSDGLGCKVTLLFYKVVFFGNISVSFSVDLQSSAGAHKIEVRRPMWDAGLIVGHPIRPKKVTLAYWTMIWRDKSFYINLLIAALSAAITSSHISRQTSSPFGRKTELDIKNFMGQTSSAKPSVF